MTCAARPDDGSRTDAPYVRLVPGQHHLRGLIGMLAVDPATGAMWNIAPDKIQRKLDAGQNALIKNKTGFVVVLASELTPAEREQMVRLN